MLHLKILMACVVSFFVITGELYAQSPGSFRDKETHGIGFGILVGNGIGSEVFYDFAINSLLQVHIFGSSVVNQGITLLGSEILETTQNLSGATLRIFPSEEFGFFIGVGGGSYEAQQVTKQEEYCSSSSAYNISECSGFEGSSIKKTTVSKLSGSAGFSEFGWQGYDGYYFTVGVRAGSVNISEEEDNTDKILEVSNHKEFSKEQWEAAKTISQSYIAFGWHF